MSIKPKSCFRDIVKPAQMLVSSGQVLPEWLAHGPPAQPPASCASSSNSGLLSNHVRSPLNLQAASFPWRQEGCMKSHDKLRDFLFGPRHEELNVAGWNRATTNASSKGRTLAGPASEGSGGCCHMSAPSLFLFIAPPILFSFPES